MQDNQLLINTCFLLHDIMTMLVLLTKMKNIRAIGDYMLQVWLE